MISVVDDDQQIQLMDLRRDLNWFRCLKKRARRVALLASFVKYVSGAGLWLLFVMGAARMAGMGGSPFALKGAIYLWVFGEVGNFMFAERAANAEAELHNAARVIAARHPEAAQ